MHNTNSRLHNVQNTYIVYWYVYLIKSDMKLVKPVVQSKHYHRKLYNQWVVWKFAIDSQNSVFFLVL